MSERRWRSVVVPDSLAAMETPLTILAVFGVAALIWHLLRALLGVGRGGVEAFIARESADVRARRGDLTGLAESEERAQRARRTRLRAALAGAGWLALLVIPLLTSFGVYIYAGCSTLWLLRAGTPESRRDGITSRREDGMQDEERRGP